MLCWSLRLDGNILFRVPGIAWRFRLEIILYKYLYFFRDCITPKGAFRRAVIFGQDYRYNDRYGIGSIQRVFCSSWKLRGILSENPVVVDVGANLGQFNLFCRTYLQAQRVISIEPIPSCYELLRQNALCADDCINLLVTEQDSNQVFYIAHDSQLSSTVPDVGHDYPEQIVVRGMPLDRILKESGIERISLLKIDTEGSEFEVLLSAGDLLDITDAVLVEMSIFRRNSGNIFAVGSFLESKGFQLRELIPGAGEYPADADGIFVRK